MSEKLCTLRTKGGGGGKYTETSLWTNPSPTSSFSGQTVTLSDSVSNYKYIAIKSGFNSSYYSDSESMTIVVPVDELKRLQTIHLLDILRCLCVADTQTVIQGLSSI